MEQAALFNETMEALEVSNLGIDQRKKKYVRIPFFSEFNSSLESQSELEI